MKDASGVFSPTVCIGILNADKAEAVTFVSVMEEQYKSFDHGYDQVIQDVRLVCSNEGFLLEEGFRFLLVPTADFNPAARMGLDAMRDGTMAFDPNFNFGSLVPTDCTLAVFLETSNAYISKLDQSDADFQREFVMSWCVISAVLKATATFPAFAHFMNRAHVLFRLVQSLAAQERTGSP